MNRIQTIILLVLNIGITVTLVLISKNHTVPDHHVTLTSHVGGAGYSLKTIEYPLSVNKLPTIPHSQPGIAPLRFLAAVPSAPITEKAPPFIANYVVRGNAIYDGAGTVHVIHGLNRPSLEWSSTGEHLSLADYQLMASTKANAIRLPLNEKYWIQDTNHYKSTVAQQVSWINGLGMDVILDLHWSDGGSRDNPADQYSMADDDSRIFWSDVATIYKNNPKVLFELYNEPRNITWDVWQNGGSIPDAQGNMFTAVGMQQLYDDVRATGANNLVIIGGINWAYDLSEVVTHRITGTNIVYATHVYDFYGKNTVADWDASFGALAKTDPVIITEFGTYNCSTALYSSLLTYARASNLSWVGWAWYPGGCGFPALITDWSGATNDAGKVVVNGM